jgi:hypothetical protein
MSKKLYVDLFRPFYDAYYIMLYLPEEIRQIIYTYVDREARLHFIKVKKYMESQYTTKLKITTYIIPEERKYKITVPDNKYLNYDCILKLTSRLEAYRPRRGGEKEFPRKKIKINKDKFTSRSKNYKQSLWERDDNDTVSICLNKHTGNLRHKFITLEIESQGEESVYDLYIYTHSEYCKKI